MHAITERQQREIDYHREYAAKNRAAIESPVSMCVIDGRSKWRW